MCACPCLRAEALTSDGPRNQGTLVVLPVPWRKFAAALAACLFQRKFAKEKTLFCSNAERRDYRQAHGPAAPEGIGRGIDRRSARSYAHNGLKSDIAPWIAQPARGTLAAEFLSPQEVASAEKPRNRLSKGNDLIEGAMM
jgi:hypothetical protein